MLGKVCYLLFGFPTCKYSQHVWLSVFIYDKLNYCCMADRTEIYLPWKQRICLYGISVLAVAFLVFCLYQQKNLDVFGSTQIISYKLNEEISVEEIVVKSANAKPNHLLLTPFIESGDIQLGQEMAKVRGHPGLGMTQSYSGFFTVDAITDSSTFFWFFPAMNGDTSSGIIVWLQGGPGQSALFSIFNSNGPYRVNSQLEITKNPFTWCEAFNLLYLDNPVGTGFSFSNGNGYSKTREQVDQYLYIAINQFLELFPEYRENPVFISGEGYGAKYAVTLANMIHGKGRDTTINLVGIALENPFLSIEVLFEYGHYLRKMGFINEGLFIDAEYHLRKASQYVDQKLWSQAMDHFEKVFGTPYGYYPKGGDVLVESHLYGESSEWETFKYYVTLLDDIEVRRAIHVGDLKFQDGETAYQALRDDVPKSIEESLSILLNNYKVLLYGGNQDNIIPYSLTLKVLDRINWQYLDEYQKSKLMIWKVNPNDHEFMGYFRKAANFFQILIKNCGHVVAFDQPAAALDLISRFITGRSFNIEDL